MNQRRVFRLYPKMGLAVSGSAEALAPASLLLLILRYTVV